MLETVIGLVVVIILLAIFRPAPRTQPACTACAYEGLLSVQMAWLSGVTGADITRLAYPPEAIEAEFVHRGHRYTVRVYASLLHKNENLMECLIEDIKTGMEL